MIMLRPFRMLWKLTTKANVSGKCTDKWPTGGVWKSEVLLLACTFWNTLLRERLARVVDCSALSVRGLTLGTGGRML